MYQVGIPLETVSEKYSFKDIPLQKVCNLVHSGGHLLWISSNEKNNLLLRGNNSEMY